MRKALKFYLREIIYKVHILCQGIGFCRCVILIVFVHVLSMTGINYGNGFTVDQPTA